MEGKSRECGRRDQDKGGTGKAGMVEEGSGMRRIGEKYGWWGTGIWEGRTRTVVWVGRSIVRAEG